jgi:hypothetical protein
MSRRGSAPATPTAAAVKAANDRGRANIAAMLDKDFRRDRFGHNNVGAEPHHGRIAYVAHGKGYVMARRPGCEPWVISEALWRSFPYWTPVPAGTSARIFLLISAAGARPSHLSSETNERAKTMDARATRNTLLWNS